MKNIFKITLLSLALAPLFTSCVEEDDVAIAPFRPLIFAETFPQEEINNNQPFDFPGWTNFIEAGSKKWIERYAAGTGFILFNPFGSPNEASNIAWAITPAINLDESSNEVLTFDSASNFVTSPANKLEVYISTDYDGNSANVLSSTWEPLDATVADNTTNGWIWVPSGQIDISSYSGNVYIAFRVVGASQAPLGGAFEIDNIKIFSAN